MPMKRKISTFLFGLLFLIGFGILIYPTVSNQWNTYRQNQLISSYDNTIQDMESEDFTSEWEKAKAFNDTIQQNNLYGDVFGEDENDIKDTEYWKILNVADDGVMGYLSIPKINIKLAIFYSPFLFFVGRTSAAGRTIGATAGLDLGNIFALLCHVDLYFVLDRCKSGKNQKCSRCKDKDSDRGIAGSTGSCIGNRNDLCPESFSGTKDLSYKTNGNQAHCKAKTHSKSVKDRRKDRVLGSITLCTSQNDTVNNDQWNVNSK